MTRFDPNLCLATFSGAQVPISVGTHTLSGPNPIGLYVYGYESFDSYGFPGGFTAGNITPP